MTTRLLSTLSWSCLLLAFAACDDAKPTPQDAVDDTTEVVARECATTAGPLRAAPLTLQFAAGPGPDSKELLVNNGGQAGNLCWTNGAHWRLEPADAPFTIGDATQKGEAIDWLAPGDNAALQVSLGADVLQSGEAMLFIVSENGGESQVRLSWVLDENLHELQITPASATFFAAAGESMTLRLDLANTGLALMALESPAGVVVEGDVALEVGPLKVGTSPVDRIAAGEAATLDITFSPTAVMEGSGALHFFSGRTRVATLPISWVSICVGADCPDGLVERRCVATGAEDTVSLTFAHKLSLLSDASEGDATFQTFIAGDGSAMDIGSGSWPFSSFGDGTDLIMPGLDPAFTPFSASPARVSGYSDGSQFCYFVFEQPVAGTTLGINFTFVGLPTLAAATAQNDADWQAMLASLRVLLSRQGLILGTVRTFDLDATNAALYTVARSYDDLDALQRLSKPPLSQNLGEVLRLNVFLVQDIDIPGSDAVGISPMPGVAGAHGIANSGLVVAASDYLGLTSSDFDNFRSECRTQNPPNNCYQEYSGNDALASVIVHEAGHFLALPHTSEFNGYEFDSFGDTPECPDATAIDSVPCADEENFMFPMVRGLRTQNFSHDQILRVLGNPLIRP